MKLLTRLWPRGPHPASEPVAPEAPPGAGVLTPIVAIVFSKDRPLQLDATLRSLAMHCPVSPSLLVVVLYTTSDSRYEAAYRVLAAQHRGVVFRREADFKSDLMEVATPAKYILFAVDDTIFTGPLTLQTVIGWLDADPDLIGFSFRLGRNTAYCYTIDRPQAMPGYERLGDAAIRYRWGGGECDFGYPIEVSSSVYRGSDILPLLGTLEYQNPNTLEGALAAVAWDLEATRPTLGCFERSVALSLPVNRVQEVWPNRAGTDSGLAGSALLERFERGERLCVASYRSFVSEACHMELGFIFEWDPAVPVDPLPITAKPEGNHAGHQAAVSDDQANEALVLVVVGRDSHGDRGVAVPAMGSLPGRRVVVPDPRGATTLDEVDEAVATSVARYVLVLERGVVLTVGSRESMIERLDADTALGFVIVSTTTDSPLTHGLLLRPAAWLRLRGTATGDRRVRGRRVPRARPCEPGNQRHDGKSADSG